MIFFVDCWFELARYFPMLILLYKDILVFIQPEVLCKKAVYILLRFWKTTKIYK